MNSEHPDFEVFDAGYITLTLITKDQVKSFYFYAPEIYYHYCPIKRDSRRRILEIKKLFSDITLKPFFNEKY